MKKELKLGAIPASEGLRAHFVSFLECAAYGGAYQARAILEEVLPKFGGVIQLDDIPEILSKGWAIAHPEGWDTVGARSIVHEKVTELEYKLYSASQSCSFWLTIAKGTRVETGYTRTYPVFETEFCFEGGSGETGFARFEAFVSKFREHDPDGRILPKSPEEEHYASPKVWEKTLLKERRYAELQEQLMNQAVEAGESLRSLLNSLEAVSKKEEDPSWCLQYLIPLVMGTGCIRVHNEVGRAVHLLRMAEEGKRVSFVVSED